MNRRSLYADDEKAKRTAAAQKRRYRARTGSGYGHHEWTAAEEELVVAHAVPDRDLAEQLGVSVTAIQQKRWRLTRREIVFPSDATSSWAEIRLLT